MFNRSEWNPGALATFKRFEGYVSRQEPTSFVEILRSRAAEEPERRIFTYLEDGERETANLTLAGLDARARAIAAALQARGMEGERALLLFPAGLDFIAAFFGCLYAGVIAVPALARHLPDALDVGRQPGACQRRAHRVRQSSRDERHRQKTPPRGGDDVIIPIGSLRAEEKSARR